MSVAPNLTVKTSIITPKNTSTCTDAIGNIVTYSYDKAGKLIKEIQLGIDITTSYDAESNVKILSLATSINNNAFTYDVNSIQTKLHYPNNTSEANSYDAFNRRISKTEDGNLTQYLYDGDDIIAILDKQNQVIATITHNESIDTPLSITNVNGTFYYHRDHQGSIIALTDSSGAVVESFTYDNHYGSIVNHTVTTQTDNPYGYTGRELDTEELYYYRARYYDATLQRFLGEDPIGFISGDFNLYRYVGNSPIQFNDPKGLKKRSKKSGRTCSRRTESILQKTVKFNCNKKRKCTIGLSCEELKSRRSAATSCVISRFIINFKCFKGGDLAHRKELLKDQRVRDNCNNILKERKDCDTCWSIF